MSINVTGSGSLYDGSHDANASQPAADPTGARAAVGGAMGRGNVSQGNPAQGSAQNIGNVAGNQYQSAGANGVTQYGLFSNAGAGGGMQPPATGRPPMQPPANAAPPGWRPPGPPSAGSTPNPMNPGTGFRPPTAGLGGPPTGLPPPPNGGSMNGMGINFGNAQQQIANAMHPPGMSGQPTTAPPRLNMAGAGQQHHMSGFGAGASPTYDALGNLLKGAQSADPSLTPAGAAAGAVAGGAADGSIAGGAGTFLGQQVSNFVNGYDSSNPGAGGGSWSDYYNAMAPGFQQNSLVGSVGQDWATASDPAAWTQMAQNRMTDLGAQNIADLNVGERRLADRQGRTGLANNGGILGNMYSQFANRGAQNNRQVFNDTLNKQMSAMGQAGQYALGQNAQDLQRWQALNGGAMMGASQDLANARIDNPSGGQVFQDVAGAAGQAAGGLAGMYGQGAGGLMSLMAMGLV